jgi:hypothetical protein
MIGFLFGVLIGFAVKMAYDFFQEERIPDDLGMAQGRAEAIMDETRQIVREMREELRTLATAAQGSAAEKTKRLQAAATEPAGTRSRGRSGSSKAPESAAEETASPATPG